VKDERRRYPRVVVNCAAKVFDLQRRLLVRGRTVDISAGGVKILGPTVNSPQAGAEVEVEIELALPDSPRRRQVLRQATVRRVEAMGDWTAVALEFAKLVEV
jgi:c-di-GMP-binding flagellar brake protein YcgR